MAETTHTEISPNTAPEGEVTDLGDLDEKARLGAPSGASAAIDGFTEEGERLSARNAGSEQLGLKKHSHGNAPVVPEASRGERRRSFDVADFPSLKRLRGLHTDALTGAAPAVAVTGAGNVTVETVERGDARLGTAATPEDRVSAAAWNAFTEATVITIPKETVADGEVMVSVTGSASDAAAQHI